MTAIKIVAVTDAPYVTQDGVRTLDAFVQNGTLPPWDLRMHGQSGFAVEIMTVLVGYLSQRHKWHNFSVVSTPRFGTTEDTQSGTHDLARGAADVGVPEWYVGGGRDHAMDFVMPPFMYAHSSVIIHPKPKTKFMLLLEPLPNVFWIAGLINLLIFCSILTIFQIVDGVQKLDNVFKPFLKVTYALLFQKTRHTYWRRSFRGCFLATLWNLLAIWGITTYKCRLVPHFSESYVNDSNTISLKTVDDLARLIKSEAYTVVYSEVGVSLYGQLLKHPSMKFVSRDRHAHLGMSQQQADLLVQQNEGYIDVAGEQFKNNWMRYRNPYLQVKTLGTKFFMISMPVAKNRSFLLQQLNLLAGRFSDHGLAIPFQRRYERPKLQFKVATLHVVKSLAVDNVSWVVRIYVVTAVLLFSFCLLEWVVFLSVKKGAEQLHERQRRTFADLPMWRRVTLNRIANRDEPPKPRP